MHTISTCSCPGRGLAIETFAYSHWRGSFSHIPCQYAGETPAVGSFHKLHFTSLWAVVSENSSISKPKLFWHLPFTSFYTVPSACRSESIRYDPKKSRDGKPKWSPQHQLVYITRIKKRRLLPTCGGKLTQQILTINISIKRYAQFLFWASSRWKVLTSACVSIFLRPT